MPPARLPPLPTLLVISMSLQHVPPQSEEEERTSLSFHLIRHVGGCFVFFPSHQIVCVLSLWHVAQHWEQCIFSIIRGVSERRSVRSLHLSCVLFRSREMCQFGKLLQIAHTCVKTRSLSFCRWVPDAWQRGSFSSKNQERLPMRTRRGCVSLT